MTYFTFIKEICHETYVSRNKNEALVTKIEYYTKLPARKVFDESPCCWLFLCAERGVVMYCDYYEEHVDVSDCGSCSRVNNCTYMKEKTAAEDERAEKIAYVQDQDLYKEMVSKLGGFLGPDVEEAEKMVLAMFDRAFSYTNSEMEKHVKYFAEKHAMEYISAKTQSMMDGAFDRAIEEKVLVITGDKASNITTIQKTITDKVTAYIDKKDSYNSRNNTSDSLEKAISKVVDSQIEEALREITEEAIEKFNKETMKTMMMGMAKAIQDNPKLLTILNATAE